MKFIGRTEKLLLYINLPEDKELQSFYKIDAKTLELVERTDYKELGILGKPIFSMLDRNQLYIFNSVLSYYGIQVDAHIFNVETLKRTSYKNLSVFNRSDGISILYSQPDSVFYLYGDHKKFCFKKALDEIKFHEHEHPYELNYKSKFLHTVYTDKERLFYPLGKKVVDRLYVKAEFIPDTFSPIGSGHIERLEIISYDTVKNFLTDKFDFEVREGTFILDFDCHLTNDGDIIIFGVYQDHTKPGQNIRLGWFSKLINKEMNDKTGYNYKEWLNAPKDDLELQHGYALCGGLYSLPTFTYLPSQLDNAYILQCKRLYLPDNYYATIRIDKKNGDISCLALNNKYISRNNIPDLYGYLEYQLLDTARVIIFNENKSNIGLPAFSDEIISCEGDTAQTVIAYCLYSMENGFSNRKILYSYAGDGEYLYIDNEAALISGSDNGNLELVVPAFNKEKNSCSLVRIMFTP